MVERLLRIFNREWNGLHEAAFLLAGTAVLSQLLGLLRDRILAYHFGAGIELDIYYAAFRIPDLLYASVASFVAVTVLIPFLLEKIDGKQGMTAAKDFVNSVFSAFVLFMGIVIAVVYVYTPSLGHLVVPGFSGETFDQYVRLSQLLLLSPLLLGISNLFGSMTQSLRRFFVFAAGPILYNVGIICGIFFLLPEYGIYGVALGVVIGALLHVAIQFPVLMHERIVPRLTFRIDWKEIGRVVRLSVPRTIALSSAQLATMVLIKMASSMQLGSIAVFTLAMNLQSIPLSVVGMSYSVAAFPTLAKLWTGGNKEQFSRQILSAARHILFWSFPAIVLFVVLRAQIVRTILGSGAFDWTATRLTAAALALFAISVVAQNLVLLFTRAFYAMGRTRLPLYANVVGAVAVILSAVLLSAAFLSHPVFRYFSETLLRVDDIAGTDVLMLPLGYSVGMTVNVLLLLFLLRKDFPLIVSGLKKAFLHSFSSSILLGFVAYHSLQVCAWFLDLDTFLGIFLQGLCSGLIGIVAWAFLLHILENNELREIRQALHRKFWKKEKPIAAELESF